MTAWTYHHTPGDLVGFASGPLLALVALDPSDALVGQLAERVADGDATLDGVLDLLVSRGLRAIDSFGLAEVTPDGVRVLVRGRCTAVGPGVSATGTTGLWHETTWPGADAVRLTVTPGEDGPCLPFAGGVVLASSLARGASHNEADAAAAVSPEPTPEPEPEQGPGVLRLPDGEVVVLDRGAVLGRNPRVPLGWTGEEPRLVRLEDPDRDVSSQHLEVRVEGDQVWVRDLGSTNGTDVVVPGAEPVALRTGELRPIVPGTRIILAGTFTVMHEAGDADQP